MTDTLQHFVERIDKVACVLFNRAGEVLPMWHVVTASGEHRIVPQSTSIDKDTAAILMRAYFELSDVVRYVFVDEAWQLETPVISDDELREIMRIGLANHPARIEVLMYQAEDRHETLTAHRIINRSNGRARLGPLEIHRPKHSEGRLVGMLPQRGAVQ